MQENMENTMRSMAYPVNAEPAAAPMEKMVPPVENNTSNFDSIKERLARMKISMTANAQNQQN